MRLHNNKKFREIQRKNKINIDVKEIQRRLRNVYRPIKLGEPDTYTDNNDNVIAKIEELKYSYTITCNNCRYKKGLRILSRQTERIMEMMEGKDETNLWVFAEFKTMCFVYVKSFNIKRIDECDDKDIKTILEQEIETWMAKGFSGGNLHKLRLNFESYNFIKI